MQAFPAGAFFETPAVREEPFETYGVHRVEDAVDFIKGQFFSCPKEAVAGVAHINIDAAVLRGGFVHFFSHLDGVRDIQNHAVKCVRVLLNQVGNLLRGADGADDTVTCRKKLFSHFTAKAA